MSGTSSAQNIYSELIFQVADTGKYLGRDAFCFNFDGRRVDNFVNNGQTDIVEFALTSGRVPILDGTQNAIIVGGLLADGPLGTGVRTVELTYLDNNWLLQTTTVNLNGLTQVTVQKSGVNIQPQAILWMHSIDVGSGSVAAGNISLSVGGNPVEMISAGGNMSLSARGAVPDGHTCYLLRNRATATVGTHDFRLRATVAKTQPRRLLAGIYNFQSINYLKEGFTSSEELAFLRLPARARFKMSSICYNSGGTSTATSGRCDASVTALFVKNPGVA